MRFSAVTSVVASQALFFCSNVLVQGLVEPASSPFAIERRSDVQNAGHESSHRRMVAARSTPDLAARDGGTSSFLKHDHVLHFIEDDLTEMRGPIRGSQSPFAAHVRLSSHLPTLLLEDNDAHLEHISCHKSTIEVEFYEHAAASAAWGEIHTHPEMVVITSHPGCNADGERRPHLVSKVEKRERFLVFSVASTSWRKSFHSIEVDFGSREDNGHLQRHDLLRKRSVAAATTTTTSASSSSSSVDFPSPPSTSPTSTSVHEASIDKSWIDTAILPPNFPGVDSASLHGPFVPHGLTINCKNCTVQGNVDLSHGTFTLTGNNANTNASIMDFYENGFVELAVHGFAAHIELESTVIPSESLYLYTAPFPDIAIPGFSIPGIATVGPVLRPRVTFGVQVATQLDFIYGFDMSTPDNSAVVLDIKNLTNSTVSGFQQASLTPIPFQSTLDSINLTVSAAFNPQLLLTISVLDNDGSINAGAFLDVPKVQATVAQVDHVDSKCNPTNSTDHVKDFVFDSLTKITPSVELDVGVLANAQVKAGAFQVEDAAVHTVWSTDYPLPTACISYNAAMKTYGAPNATNPGATGASGGTGSKSGSTSLHSTGSLSAGAFPLYIFCIVLLGLL